MALPPRNIARARDRGGSWYRQRAAWREGAAGHRRRIRGDKAFRRLLKKLPESAREVIYEMFLRGGDRILATQRAHSPSSRARAALSRRVSKQSLRLRAGLIGRALNRELFFAHILEKGRKAQTVNVRRRTPSGKESRYAMRVKAMPQRPFVNTPLTREMRNTMGGELGHFWDRTLLRAGEGIGDD